MMANARLFVRGIEAALAKKCSLKEYIVKVRHQTPEHFQTVLEQAKAELEALEE